MDQDMLSDFYVEAEELYAEAEDALLDLEKSNKFEENYNSIFRAFKLLNKSLDLIVYQFEDFDKYLEQDGLDSKRKVLREELKIILKQKKILVERVR